MTQPQYVPLPETDLIPLALIVVETGETLERLAHLFGDEVVLDDVGMRAVSASAAQEFFTARREQTIRLAEASAQRAAERAEQAERRVPAGVPAQEGMTPFEAMAAAGGVVTPGEEFGGRERPNFLDEELAAGRRAAAEKQRRVEQMKRDLQ